MIPRPDAASLPIRLRRELVAEGWHDRAILRMVTTGRWVRVRHGAYCDAEPFERLDRAGRHVLETRAVLRQAQTPLVVSHTSSLAVRDAPTWAVPLDDVHVTRRDGRIGRHEAGVHQHRGRILPDDVVLIGEIPVMSATRTVLEVSTLVSVEPALVIANHMLHAGLTSRAALERRYRDPELSMELWPGSLSTDLVLRLADGRCESVGESRAYYLFFSQHLPLPELQLDVYGERGALIGRVDFAWPELGVFLEFDGRVKYEKLLRPGERASDVVVREKRREELICRVTGWRCIRLTWADLENPARTAALIRAVLNRSAA